MTDVGKVVLFVSAGGEEVPVELVSVPGMDDEQRFGSLLCGLSELSVADLCGGSRVDLALHDLAAARPLTDFLACKGAFCVGGNIMSSIASPLAAYATEQLLASYELAVGPLGVPAFVRAVEGALLGACTGRRERLASFRCFPRIQALLDWMPDGPSDAPDERALHAYSEACQALVIVYGGGRAAQLVLNQPRERADVHHMEAMAMRNRNAHADIGTGTGCKVYRATDVNPEYFVPWMGSMTFSDPEFVFDHALRSGTWKRVGDGDGDFPMGAVPFPNLSSLDMVIGFKPDAAALEALKKPTDGGCSVLLFARDAAWKLLYTGMEEVV